MSRIFITGDTHGNFDIHKLSSKRFDTNSLTKEDYVIICGDFGLIWSPEGYGGFKESEYWLDWLEDKPFTTLFVDGNHENFDLLDAFPTETWNGGKVHRIRTSVIHLTRGQIFTLDDKTFFTMGGALSCDKAHRQEGTSWWPQEVPNMTERAEAIESLEHHNWKVDYVLTHCAPTEALDVVLHYNDMHPDDEYCVWLQEIAGKLDFKLWFFGHYHTDKAVKSKYWALYDCFFDLQNDRLISNASDDALKIVLDGKLFHPDSASDWELCCEKIEEGGEVIIHRNMKYSYIHKDLRFAGQNSAVLEFGDSCFINVWQDLFD